ncbi:MAG: nitroreductase family protein [Sphingobium sp.]|nr:nitroreductase family protein [Sphingobium sp.]MBP6111266.1 nitroreductase family protein [Sphingobium sp.]MBP8670863.1 nitroreductase family protein [Sphingobium sp.]MBP9156710.1 nitroreductase family protein [Sphingobium sp.]MCC6483128.1 nitroreductase family protein [Sphingomonadaceae bacterium]
MSERTADHIILPQFLERWSPRAYDPRPIDEETLKTVLEAARWAPSAFNYQPWRFACALRGDGYWKAYLDALIPFNQAWAANASALIYIVSDTIMEAYGERKPSHSHSFDSGAAWMAMALQAHSMGLITHGMSGIDFDKAAKAINLPEGFSIEAAVALGYPGDKAILPKELQEREVPSDRKPLGETMVMGSLVR